jgi:hypothetical protein
MSFTGFTVLLLRRIPENVFTACTFLSQNGDGISSAIFSDLSDMTKYHKFFLILCTQLGCPCDDNYGIVNSLSA